jgi:mRNA-degrading endonuclease toxin of MazEF toxin-antitoxin module
MTASITTRHRAHETELRLAAFERRAHGIERRGVAFVHADSRADLSRFHRHFGNAAKVGAVSHSRSRPFRKCSNTVS